MAIGAWFEQVVNWSTVISAVVAVFAVVTGFFVATKLYQLMALVSQRARWIAPAVRSAGIHVSWFRFTRSAWLLIAARIRSGHSGVREELTWLAGLHPVVEAEAGLSPDFPVPLPFTFTSQVVDSGYSSALTGLARAYEGYASSVRRRWLLRSAAAPLVGDEHACARETAGLLRRWASFEPIRDPANPDGLRGMLVELSDGIHPRSVRLVTWPDMTAARAVVTFPSVGVSFQPYRVEMDGSPARQVRPDVADMRVVANVLDPAVSGSLFFDGVLPRWHGPGFRIEVDRVTGRQKLHLCVAETTYFAFQATQVPAAVERAGDAALCARVLTLNLLAVDPHDVVVLVRRSDHVVQNGCYTGTISGNCELVAREGLPADLDAAGLPDLLAAIARESREELGLEITPASHLAALGIIEINSETELGTHVLVATARLPGRARDYRADWSAPDPVEGLWEVGEEVMTVDLHAALRDSDAGFRLVNWLRTSAGLTPGGAGSLLLLMIAKLELRQQQARRPATNGRQTCGIPWTTSDLADWLRSPPGQAPVDVEDLISSHPLWQK